MNGTTDNVFDVVIMGAGPVGQTVAGRVRAAELKVAVVEQELVGGDCAYWGCIPSKAMLRPVIALADTCRVDGVRDAVSDPLNAARVFGRRDRYVANWDGDCWAHWVKEIGAELFRGHALVVIGGCTPTAMCPC